MLRRVTWRSWTALGAVLGVYGALGFWLSSNGTAEEELYKWGLTALAVSPVVLMSVYTATGNKWHRNDVGSALAVLAFGITWTAWPLAWTFWFLHGVLTASWLAWIEVSGPAVVALAILRLCFVFLRYHRDGTKEDLCSPGSLLPCSSSRSWCPAGTWTRPRRGCTRSR